jgi:arylsulfatase A-like enzyme
VSLIDLYPTLINICGLPEQPNTTTHQYELDGRSLLNLLKDPECAQWDGSDVVFSSVRGNTDIHHSVRSLTHRYTLCQNGEEELYDHQNDPYEWHNLAADPRYSEVKTVLRQRLLSLLYPEPKQG